ncbi:hypothetical protein VE02_05264 [Pseudogymnoascus sp. 03VT05]|nr:hypothetical protein VE02_05264 [Pseudogymnoascus sp. 03VT05]
MEAADINPTTRQASTPTPTASAAPPAAAPAAGGSPGTATKRKRVACTLCREAKVRCVGPADRCARCERLGVECRTDKGFRRSNKRSKVEALERQVERLLEAAEHGGTAELRSLRGSTAPMGGSVGVEEGGVVTPRTVRGGEGGGVGVRGQESEVPGERSAGVPRAVERPVTAERGEGVTPGPEGTTARVIEGVKVGSGQIDSLFRLYFARFHPFLPLLDPARSPDQYYESSTLLFWAIIAIAARRHRDYPRLLDSLAGPVSNLLWKTVQVSATELMNLWPVQAFIILCTWPLPSNRVWTDPSFMLSNIAVTSAIQIGLHRPKHPKEFLARPSRQYVDFVVNESETSERMRTWAACNIISQSITADFGHGSAGPCFDWAIDQACDNGLGTYSLPDEIRHCLIIQRFCYRVTKAMMTGANSTGLPLEHDRYLQLMLLEEELNVIEQQLGSQLSEINHLRHNEARLYLNLYHFLDSTLPEPRRNGILKAHHAASTLITRLMTSSPDSSGWYDRLLYAPLHTFRLLCTASIVLITTINSTYSEYLDASAGKLLFNSAVFAIRRMSIREGDGPERGACVMAEMWGACEAAFRRQPGEPRIRIKARMAASLTYDIFLRRHIFTTHKGGGGNAAADKGLPTPASGDGGSNEEAGLMEDCIMDYWQDFPNPSYIWDDDFSTSLADFIT